MKIRDYYRRNSEPRTRQGRVGDLVGRMEEGEIVGTEEEEDRPNPKRRPFKARREWRDPNNLEKDDKT